MDCATMVVGSMANNNSFGDSEFPNERGKENILFKLGAKHID
jgi:hypothetical protein